MLRFIVFFLVVVLAIVRVMLTSKAQQQKASAKPNVEKRGQKTRPNVQRRGKTSGTPVPGRTKYGSQNPVGDVAKKSREDILSAAVENTREVERENELDAVAAENTLETIYDLMAKGPDDTLKGQRDFVAEGMAMLTSYTELPYSGKQREYL